MLAKAGQPVTSVELINANVGGTLAAAREATVVLDRSAAAVGQY